MYSVLRHCMPDYGNGDDNIDADAKFSSYLFEFDGVAKHFH